MQKALISLKHRDALEITPDLSVLSLQSSSADNRAILGGSPDALNLELTRTPSFYYSKFTVILHDKLYIIFRGVIL